MRLLLLLILFVYISAVITIEWLALKEEDVSSRSVGEEGETVSDEGATCSAARSWGVQPCAALQHVARAATLTKSTCKRVHAPRRWNCSSIDAAPHFTPELLLGTKEQSFVYALSSAALTYAMARACSSGSLFSCTCGQPPRDRPDGNFKWGGCSDNVKWASRFVRQFVEARQMAEEKQDYDEDPEKEQYSKTMQQDHKNIDFTTSLPYGTAEKNTKIITRETRTPTKTKARKSKRLKTLNKFVLEKRLKRLRPYILAANSQNSKAGRKIMERSLAVQCKCHGVSGSCSVRTCWRSLQSLTSVAENLWESVEHSTKVSAPKPWIRKRAVDLVYVTQSPSYCSQDPSMGSYGTKDRWCNATIQSSEGSCRYMCCGRGYKTFVNETVERCNCKYIWCCRVECDVCKITTETYYCN